MHHERGVWEMVGQGMKVKFVIRQQKNLEGERNTQKRI